MTISPELVARVEALEACDREDANCWKEVRSSMHELRERVEALEEKQRRHASSHAKLGEISRSVSSNLSEQARVAKLESQ
jgi:hypothetical protein